MTTKEVVNCIQEDETMIMASEDNEGITSIFFKVEMCLFEITSSPRVQRPNNVFVCSYYTVSLN
jgi:hypothetical protein